MATYSMLPYDVLCQLCLTLQTVDSKTLKELSSVDKRTRSAVMPALFRSVTFPKQWYDEGVPWEEVPESTAALMGNGEILSSVRRFKFKPWAGDPTDYPLPQQFFDLLRAFTNLTELELLLQTEYFEQIRDELLGPNTTEMKQSHDNGAKYRHIFSSVQSLTITSPALLQLSPIFPNISSLEIDDWDTEVYGPQVVLDYEYISRVFPNLKRLHSPEQGISIVIQEIVRHLPNIEDLGLFGAMTEDLGWFGPKMRGGGILEHLPSYAQLTKLHSLSLPGESQLGLGFHPPFCGNAYMQPGMAELVEKERLEAQARLFQGIEAKLICMENGHKGALRQLTVGNPKWGYDQYYLVGPDGKLKKAALTGDD